MAEPPGPAADEALPEEPAGAPEEPPLPEDYLPEDQPPAVAAAEEEAPRPRRSPWQALLATVERLRAPRAPVEPAAAEQAAEAGVADEDLSRDDTAPQPRKPWPAFLARTARGRATPSARTDAGTEVPDEPSYDDDGTQPPEQVPPGDDAVPDQPSPRRRAWPTILPLAAWRVARRASAPAEYADKPAPSPADPAPGLDEPQPVEDAGTDAAEPAPRRARSPLFPFAARRRAAQAAAEPEALAAASEPEAVDQPAPDEGEWPAEDVPAQVPPPEEAAPVVAVVAVRRRRRWPWYVLGGVGVVLVVVIAAVLYAPTFIEGQAVATLRDMGFADAALTVESVGKNQAVVRGLSLGPEVSADEVVASYSVSGLMDGAVERVVIRGLRTKLTADDTGPLFGSLDAAIQQLLSPSEDETAMAIPALVLEDALIEVATPIGLANVHVAGQITPNPEPEIATAIGFDVQADAPLGRIAARLEATVDVEGAIAGSIIITEGKVSVADQGSTNLAGYIQFVLSPEGEITQLASNLNLTEPAYAGAAFTTGTIRAELNRELASLNLLLDDAADKFDVRSTLVVQDPFGKPSLSGLVETTLGPGAPVWAMAGFPEPTAGRLRATATVSAPLPAGAVMQPAGLVDALLEASGLAGSFQFDLEGMAWPELGNDIFASGSIDLRHEDGKIVATVPAEILAEITPAPALLDGLGLPDDLRQSFTGHSIASLAFAESLFVESRQDTMVLSGRPLLTLIGPGGQEVSADVWGTATFGKDGMLKDFRIDAGRLSGIGIDVEGYAFDSLELNGSFSGTPTGLTGSFRVAAQMPTFSVEGDVDLADVDVLLDCEVALAETGLSLRLVGSDSRLITRVLTPDVIRQTKPVNLSLRPHKDPLLAMDWGPPGFSLSFHALTGPLPFTAQLDTDLPLPSRFSGTDLSGGLTPSGDFTFTAITDGARATMPTMGLAATGVSARVDVDTEGITRIRYKMASVTQGGESPYVVPLSLAGTVTIDDVRVAFDGTGRAAGEGLVLKAKGQHRLDPNNGEVDLSIDAITFAPGALQPADLFPPLAGALEEAAGKLAAEGRIAWDETTEVMLTLGLEDLTLKTPQVTLTGVNGTVTLDGVDPLSTPPHQQIVIGSVDLGLPLTDGVLAFQIEPENKLRIERARLTLAGGEVSAQPAVIDWTSGTQRTVLLAHDVGLQALLDLVDIDGLSAEGKLDGSIPVLVQDGAVIIKDGKLVAQGPGVIRYAPEQDPGVAAAADASESMDLVLDLLQNFQYSALELGLERDAKGDMKVSIGLDGSNPEVYDGYPIDFNLNLSGNVDELLNR